MSKKDYDIHPAAKLFPMMEKEPLGELAKDIRKNGLVNSIILCDGMILDGRNRFVACQIAGVEPRFMPFASDLSPTEWVLSQNLHRRHLTASQKAAVAVGALPLLEEEAKERKAKGAAQRDHREIIPSDEKGKASEKAAELTGANARYVSDAKRIAEEAPETFEKVKSGEMSIPEAKRELKWDVGASSAAEPKESAPEDNDSGTLWNLKRLWRAATKKEKSEFLKWAKEN